MQKFIAIKDVYAKRKFLDSRGNPTIEVEVLAEGDIVGRAAVAVRASTGQFEAVELRDQERRYNGLGVRRAAEHINTILADCVGLVIMYWNSGKLMKTLSYRWNREQRKSGGKCNSWHINGSSSDGGKGTASAAVSVSLSGTFAHQMPVPMMNILNGGRHASNTVDLQEFMIMPFGAENFSKGLQMCAEIYSHTEKGFWMSGVINRSWRRGRICPEPEKFRRSPGYHCGSGREERVIR